MARERYIHQTEEYKGHKIEICLDDEAESPRDWDNLGTIYSNNPRHNFDGKSVKDLVRECGKNPDNYDTIPFSLFSKKYIWAKVYAYEHSGMTVTVADSNPYPDQRWDSYLLGVVAISKEKARKEYGWKRVTPQREKFVIGVMSREIETLDQYLTGEVYGYVVKDKDGNETDSCWGYFGDEGIKEAIAEAKDIIDYTMEHAA